jgi:HK97 family phage portal protein
MRSLIGSLVGRPSNRSPVSYTTGGLASQLTSMKGDPVGYMEAYAAVGTLFGIVSLLSNATSQVAWRLWRKSTDARRRYEAEETRTEITRHPALDLWNHPNPFYTRQQFVEMVQQHVDLTGEGCFVPVPIAGTKIPGELWPIRPDRLTPVPDRDRFIRGYIYTGPNGEEVPLGPTEVIRLIMPNPLDPYRGLGPVQSIMMELQGSHLSAAWNRNFFLNSAEPGGVIELDGSLGDGEWESFQEHWREQHQGVAAAHRVAVLEKGRWVERKYTMRDMEFTKLRGLNRELIREAFRMHSHMLGISEDVNKANADAAEIGFARWLVMPRCNRWKEALNSRLLPLFGELLAEATEFDHDKVVPEDREADDRERTSKAQSAQLLASVGVWEPDDILRAMGLPEMAKIKAPPPAPAVPALPPGDDMAPAAMVPREAWDVVVSAYQRARAGEIFALNGR